MIIHCQDLLGHPTVVKVFCPLNNQINYLSSLRMVKVILNKVSSSPCIDQMVKTGPGNIIFFNEVKYLRDLVYVQTIHGKPESHLKICFLTVFYAVHSFSKGPLFSTKMVMDFLHSI